MLDTRRNSNEERVIDENIVNKSRFINCTLMIFVRRVGDEVDTLGGWLTELYLRNNRIMLGKEITMVR